MYKCELWNKKDNIQGTPATDYLSWNPSWAEEDVLIIKYGDIVEEVSSVNVIKLNYKLDINLTSEQVAQAYANIKNNALSNEKDYAEKISTLEAENKKLNEITKEQDQLLVDNAYTLKILEMNIGGMQHV